MGPSLLGADVEPSTTWVARERRNRTNEDEADERLAAPRSIIIIIVGLYVFVVCS